jgi:hypothetical protein
MGAGLNGPRVDHTFSLVTATAKICGSLSDADRDSRSASLQWCAASVVNLASVAIKFLQVKEAIDRARVRIPLSPLGYTH